MALASKRQSQPASSVLSTLNTQLSTDMPPPIMIPATISRRSFLKTSTALAGAGPILASSLMAQTGADKAPLIAYVGTYSSALPIIRPGQVDLPAGNGRGIHLFDVDRVTGALSPRGVFEQATSPSCLALNSSGTRLYSVRNGKIGSWDIE